MNWDLNSYLLGLATVPAFCLITLFLIIAFSPSSAHYESCPICSRANLPPRAYSPMFTFQEWAHNIRHRHISRHNRAHREAWVVYYGRTS